MTTSDNILFHLAIFFGFSKTQLITQTFQEKCQQILSSFQTNVYFSHLIEHILDMQAFIIVHNQQIFKSIFNKNAFEIVSTPSNFPSFKTSIN